MTDKRILTAALIEAVRSVQGKRWQQVVLGLHCQLEMDEEPDIAGVADMLGVPLDRLVAEFSRCALESTGDLLVPHARIQ